MAFDDHLYKGQILLISSPIFCSWKCNGANYKENITEWKCQNTYQLHNGVNGNIRDYLARRKSIHRKYISFILVSHKHIFNLFCIVVLLYCILYLCSDRFVKYTSSHRVGRSKCLCNWGKICSWKAPDEQDIEVEGGEDGDGEGEEEEEDVGDSRPLVRARPQTELSLTNGFRLSG